MSRPIKHAKTGVYWLRKRVPSDLFEKIGRSVITKSLGTKDPAEARQKHAELLAELEAQWANLRLGDRMVTDRDAHFLAKTVGEEWVVTYRDNPSHQLLWHPDIYEGMWTRFPLPESEAESGIPGSAPIANFFWKAMRDHCLSEAQRLLGDYGFSRDNWSLYKTARALGAALQKASLELRRQEHGEFPPGDEPVGLSQRFEAPSTITAGQNARASINAPNALSSPTLMDLVEGWWREGQAAGLKPSTYESYHNTFKNFVRFLGHDRFGDVGVNEVVAFKDHRLSTPSSRTGKIPSAKTVKHSDLSALKAVFDWAVRNGHTDSNPATTVTIKLAKPARLRSKGFTNAEAVAILNAATEHQNDRERQKTCAAKRWIPWLCAFTGARVGELGQLRKQDVRLHDGIWTIIITPEAGTVKTNEAREVPIHQQVIDLGF